MKVHSALQARKQGKRRLHSSRLRLYICGTLLCLLVIFGGMVPSLGRDAFAARLDQHSASLQENAPTPPFDHCLSMKATNPNSNPGIVAESLNAFDQALPMLSMLGFFSPIVAAAVRMGTFTKKSLNSLKDLPLAIVPLKQTDHGVPTAQVDIRVDSTHCPNLLHSIGITVAGAGIRQESHKVSQIVTQDGAPWFLSKYSDRPQGTTHMFHVTVNIQGLRAPNGAGIVSKGMCCSIAPVKWALLFFNIEGQQRVSNRIAGLRIIDQGVISAIENRSNAISTGACQIVGGGDIAED